MQFKLTAPCHFGLEKTLSFEIKRAGGTDIEVTDGRVNFCGDENVLIKANISCSVAERVGIVLAAFKAVTFDDIFDEVKKIRIHEYLPMDAKFPVVKGQSINSKLESIPALQRTVKKALVTAMSRHYKLDTLPESGELYPIRFFLHKDNMLLVLDTSGDGLYKRGYRAENAGAPIKETLAAGLVDLARVKGDSVVVDPFCGSGTLLIEAAYKALRIPPCINRSFAFERWEIISKALVDEIRTEYRSQIVQDSSFRAYGYDIDKRCAELTRSNAWKAGVEKYITVEARPIAEFSYPAEKVKVITNPPYAKRLLEQDEAETVYADMGKTLLPRQGNELYIINSNERFEEIFGEKSTKNRKLYNGMLQCRFSIYL